MAHLDVEPLRDMGLMEHSGSVRQARGPSPGADVALETMRIGDLLVEVRSLAACADIAGPWRELARNAAEPNVFFEPDIILASAQHLREAAGHGVMLVWDNRSGDVPRLLALWPMKRPKLKSMPHLAKGFATRYACSGVPLLDKRFAVEAACALIAALQMRDGGPSGALFNQIPLDGAAARALRAAAALSGLATSELGTHARACVWREPAMAGLKSGTGKLRREMGRLARTLATHGDVRLITARTPEDVRVATELFLALEASGWKARRGTSILADARDAAFYRTVTRTLAREGKIAVHLLETGGRVAAAALVVSSADHAWYVKTSHDEALGAASPGALLSYQLGQTMMEQDGTLFLDSCAIAGHQMIERVWKGRVRMGDLVIGLTAQSGTAIAREMSGRRARQIAKRFYYQLRGWPM